ncbi:glycine betaine/proline transport system ATP-binding protein [Andreprevotia lacus DSM 23236]|jgi:glycine betaine/proline transport system ATP-binding protein|uniref:Glycine betaine/proline transport system ATP-binding protein n=1 Tax=Andreprevotia lacus DSM 23236 TaxID=1121001 RepID=A0A1W1XZ77_9NEIS|nr:ATP-binding cassette domain-containing protein [Andreprevotia lacus]SMC29270.1 glycine betaine/proline transport system ATP-binding protein [Andreprevotia lacus DSM 23236]
MSHIEARNVYKVYGGNEAAALRLLQQGADKASVQRDTGAQVGLIDISLAIAPAQTQVVMGLSGSGKSTLVRHFNRLIDPSAGQVLINGRDILQLDAAGLRQLRRRTVSMVFQGFGLLPHRNVLDNVAYGLLTRGECKADAHAQARHWLERVGLAGDAQRYPHALSGGMRQRVGLARALAMDSDILLMDEPFSALDPLIRRDMQQLLLALQGELQKTIVFITHDVDEAFRLGHRIALLRDGRLVQQGTPEELRTRPADEYVARFVAVQS